MDFEQAPTEPARTEPSDPTAADKPAGFVLFGETHPFESWRGLLLQVCEALAQRHADFAAVAGAVRGRKRQYVAASPDGLYKPLPIARTGLWLEGNQSRSSALRVVERLLAAFAQPPDLVELVTRTVVSQ